MLFKRSVKSIGIFYYKKTIASSVLSYTSNTLEGVVSTEVSFFTYLQTSKS